jgi:raffinose/stachyose/melibiose transport system permease protein
MVLPTLAVYTALVVYPVVYSLFFSFTDFIGFGEASFIGMENYLRLGNDPLFWRSLGNTFLILVLSVMIIIPCSFLLALLVNRPFRGVRAIRALLFAPAIISPILVGLIWIFVLDPRIGLLDAVLRALGVAEPPIWIGGADLGPYSIALVFIWSTLGFAMTLFYAGRQLVPADVLEASALDGASPRQQVFHIVVPLMKETFGITTVLVITNVFKIFEIVYQLTGGGPIHKSETLVSYMYFVTFSNQNYGLGMALAVIITVLGAFVSLGYLVLLTRRREVMA